MMCNLLIIILLQVGSLGFDFWAEYFQSLFFFLYMVICETILQSVKSFIDVVRFLLKYAPFLPYGFMFEFSSLT